MKTYNIEEVNSDLDIIEKYQKLRGIGSICPLIGKYCSNECMFFERPGYSQDEEEDGTEFYEIYLGGVCNNPMFIKSGSDFVEHKGAPALYEMRDFLYDYEKKTEEQTVIPRTIEHFIKKHLNISPGRMSSMKDVFDLFCDFLHTNELGFITQKSFFRCLGDMGYRLEKRNGRLFLCDFSIISPTVPQLSSMVDI